MADSEPDRGDDRGTSPADSLLSENYISDDEWDVEDLLAERVMKGDALGRPAGERCWLVKWTGFELAEATWEPREHLTEELLKRWEEEKRQHHVGTKKPFKVREWKKACIQYWQNKIAKQKDVNRRKKRDGQKPEPVDCIIHVRESLKSVDSEDDSDDDLNWADLDRNAEVRDGSSDFFSQSSRESTPSSSATDVEQSSTNQDSRQKPSQGSPQDASAITPTSASAAEKQRHLATRKADTSIKKPLTAAASKDGQKKGERQTQVRTPQQIVQAPPKLASDVQTMLSENQPRKIAGSSGSATVDYPRTTHPAATRARKTQQPSSHEAVGNVFVSGTKPKKRPTIDQALDTSSVDPRILKLRYQNIIEKRLRDNEGTRDPRLARKTSSSTHKITTGQQDYDAPTEERSLFVTPDPDSRSGTCPPNQDKDSLDGEISHAETPGSEPIEEGPSRYSRLVSSAFAGTSMVSLRTDVQSNGTPDKRRKAVHFGNNEPEPMDLDSNNDLVIVPDDVQPHVAPAPQTPLRDVIKTCNIGAPPTHTVESKFMGLSGEVLTTHLSEFQSSQVLNFTHQCSEDDFVYYRAAIQANVVADGYVQSNDLSNILKYVNGRLISPRRALLCYIGSLCVLLAPNASSKSRPEGFGSNVPVISDKPAFVIFRPPEKFEARSLDLFNPGRRSLAPGKLRDNSLGLDTLLKFKSEWLLPRNLSGRLQDSQTVFFLLFPLSRQDECLLLAKWLRQCNSSCEVLSSLIGGHWSIFKSLSSGAMIIHQSVIETIRFLPDLGKLLWSPDSTSNFSFWAFEPNSQQDSPDSDGDIIDCHNYLEELALKPLLPAGTVFLMTPSFLLAQPEPAYRFLKWFSQNFVDPQRPPGPVCKLALFGNPERWMAELLDDVVAGSVTRTAGSGSSEEEIAVRSKTQRLLTKLLSRVDIEDPDLLISPLILAPTCIDGNDEQSLVNWFSCWATTQLNMFRRFEVVGTGHSDRFRLERRVRAPRYKRSSIADPGAPVETCETTTASASQVALAPPPALREAVVTMQDGLGVIERESLSKSPQAILFRKPVSYFAPGMAVHLGDAGSRLATFDEWFSFFRPLRSIGGRNTHVGLFYTTDAEWDPDAHPADMSPPCRPWFAVFRPQDPSRKPWSSTELLIWDSFLSRTFCDSDDIFESDLIPSQRTLISIVAHKNSERNPQAPLRQVWIGGFESSDPNSNPLQHTLNRLHQLFENFRSDLDARSDRLHKCGWKAVKSGARATGLRLSSATPKAQSATAFTVGESDTEDDVADRKIVFHPPKGDTKLFSRQLENRLLKQTQKAKDEGKVEYFDFLFAPTQQWYGYLKGSRRHSEHIRVVQWTTIFSEFGLPTGQN
jgi:chromo domain-containing protein 1